MNVPIYQTGCLCMAGTIIMGAIGGHRKDWSEYQRETYHKAVFYQFMNSIGMLVASKSKSPKLPYTLFGMGIAFFCLPLYHKVIFQSEKYTKIPPIGGISMIIGWIWLAIMV